MIPVYLSAVFILASGQKILAINLPLIWLLFYLSLENRH